MQLCSITIQSAEKDSCTFSFAQLSDVHWSKEDSTSKSQMLGNLINTINKSGVDFTVITGDLVHMMKLSLFKDLKSELSKLNNPYYLVPGNHDVGMITSSKTLKNYRELIGNDFYFIEHKKSLFIMVNTQLWLQKLNSESTSQDRWLNKLLGVSDTNFSNIFILGHKPLFLDSITEEYHPNKNIPFKKRQELAALFRKHKTTAVLGGHLHRYNMKEYCGTAFINIEAMDHNGGTVRIWKVGTGEDFIKMNNLK